MQELDRPEGLDDALGIAADQPILLFKHSTRCPISAAALKRTEAWLTQQAAAPPFYLIKVIESRGLSQEIARRFAVEHQSPQALLIYRGAVRWHASHGAIQAAALDEAVSRLS